MTFLIVGSAAAKHHIPTWREPKDLDVFSPSETLQGADRFWHEDFEAIWPSRPAGLLQPRTDRYATVDELYTIKMSHIYWRLKNGSWQKHKGDLILLKEAGAKLIPDLHTALYKVWEKEYGKKIIDLNQDKVSFFGDAVRRKYDHDSVHYSVSYFPHPMYTHFLKDGEEVAMDMKEVWAAPFDDQVRLFREEIYATALERKVIPSNYTVSPLSAYQYALQLTVTNLTKGRSARFIAENLDIFDRPDVNYVQVHKDKAHMLIPFEEGK